MQSSISLVVVITGIICSNLNLSVKGSSGDFNTVTVYKHSGCTGKRTVVSPHSHDRCATIAIPGISCVKLSNRLGCVELFLHDGCKGKSLIVPTETNLGDTFNDNIRSIRLVSCGSKFLFRFGWGWGHRHHHFHHRHHYRHNKISESSLKPWIWKY